MNDTDRSHPSRHPEQRCREEVMTTIEELEQLLKDMDERVMKSHTPEFHTVSTVANRAIALCRHQQQQLAERDAEVARLRDWIQQAMDNTTAWQEVVMRSKLPAQSCTITHPATQSSEEAT